MAHDAEIPALARLGFDELGGAMAGIGNVHRAVADLAFGASGPGATPARVVHDAVARRVYGGLRLGSRTVGRAAGEAAAQLRTAPLSSTPVGAVALGVLNGLIGDQLERDGSALGVPMTLRVEGERTPRLVVFLHGLMESDRSWALGGGPTYGERLAQQLGLTAVYVHYNTGRNHPVVYERLHAWLS